MTKWIIPPPPKDDSIKALRASGLRPVYWSNSHWPAHVLNEYTEVTLKSHTFSLQLL